jgi:hypothetical protein
VTDEEYSGLLTYELGICEHNAEQCLYLLRELLEVGDMRTDGDEFEWEWAELRLDAALPYHPSRSVVLAWVSASGLIEHDEDPDIFRLSERGAEVLERLRAADGDGGEEVDTSAMN